MLLSALILLAAQDKPLDCEKDQSQLALNLCADRDYHAADAEMSAQWKRTLAVVHGFDKDPDYPPGKKTYSQKLIEAQRAWLAYRDAHCASASYRPAAGSMEPMLFSLCMLGLTEERRQQLADIARGGRDE